MSPATARLTAAHAGKVSNASSSAWLQVVDFKELAQGFAALAPVRVLWNLQGGLPEGTEGVVLGHNTLIVGSWIDYNVRVVPVLAGSGTAAICRMHGILRHRLGGSALIDH